MSRVTVLTGGVGGAKLVVGLVSLLGPGKVTAIVNTGDDFSHLGLDVSPDIDTLVYTLAGKADPIQGWGRAGETWSFMASLASLGGEDWFRLGDGDLAMHVLRTRARRDGVSLSRFTAGVAASWATGAEILPMSDDVVATEIETRDEGVLPFQRYFVGRRCEPVVRAIRFRGAATARPGPGVIAAITDPAVRAVLIAPSNPFLSVDPLLAVPGLRGALAAASAPVVAVSPLVAGAAVKGPTAKLMHELGLPVTPAAVAEHYADFLAGMVVDQRDAGEPPPGIAILATDTLMHDDEDRQRVARAALTLADRLRR